jgi:DNA-binding transcriptional ArsR family regulator
VGNSLRDVFDAIADPTRRRLIRLLAEADEIPLHEITAQRTAVSKHLIILNEANTNMWRLNHLLEDEE